MISHRIFAVSSTVISLIFRIFAGPSTGISLIFRILVGSFTEFLPTFRIFLGLEQFISVQYVYAFHCKFTYKASLVNKFIMRMRNGASPEVHLSGYQCQSIIQRGPFPTPLHHPYLIPSPFPCFY